MKKAKVIEMYAGLDLTKSGLEKHVVVDKHHQVFIYDSASLVSIVRDAIQFEFAGWTAPSWDAHLDEMHQLAFGSAISKKADRVEASVYAWKKLLLKGNDRTTTGNPINQPKEGDVKTAAKLATRKYYLGMDSNKPEVVSSIHTPQAKVCYAILVAGLKAHPEGITETDLKALVNTRAAEIKTRQDPWRIFQYYRPTLIKAKLARHD